VRARWQEITFADLHRAIVDCYHRGLASFRGTGPDPKWMSYYDYITNGKIYRYPVDTELKLGELRQGISRASVDELLSRIEPLKSYMQEMMVRHQLLGLKSETTAMSHAFVAAADFTSGPTGHYL